jgi:carboxypeptidase family protein
MNRSLVLLALLALSQPLGAQVTVNGTVSNESGRPLEQSQVTLDPQGANRQLRTDREGRFNFLGVPPGQHVVRVIRVGFSPESKQVDVANANVTVDFTLHRVQVLDTVAVTAKRTGLYGSVISSDSLLPVPGARVEIIGARKADSTTSSGTFNFPDLKAGSYIVRVKHPFFESRNFGVVVPVDGGTELDVVVQPGRVSRDQHMDMLYREMDTRLTFRGVNTAFVTREELKGRERSLLDQALTFTPEFSRKNLWIASDVCVFVDGVARPGATIRDFAAEDIESIELYGALLKDARGNQSRGLREADPSGSLRDRWPPRTPCGMPLTPNEAIKARTGWSEVKVMFAVVWLKK